MSASPDSTTTTCAICNRVTTLFNYGVLCCNACKMFYRRALTCKRPKVCKCSSNIKKESPQEFIPNKMCGYCRYSRCLEVGMTCNLEIEQKLMKSSDFLTDILEKLVLLDSHRQGLFLNYHAPGDLPLEQAFQEPIKFTLRPFSNNLKFSDWSTIEQLTTINYFKHMDFTNELIQSDRTAFLKNAYFHSSIFMNAMRSYTWKKALMVYPNDIDCPEGTVESGLFSTEFTTRIKCRLVGRMIELQITQQEFLLLSVLLFCDPGIENLTPHGRSLIAKNREKYQSALFQYCSITHQQSGPSRFMDLISLCSVLKRTIKDISYFFIIYQMHVVRGDWRKVFVDSVKSVSLN